MSTELGVYHRSPEATWVLSCAVYIILDRYFRTKYSLYGPRMISTVHAIAVCMASFPILLDMIHPLQYREILRFCSFGYFTVDGILTAFDLKKKYSHLNVTMVIHHIIAFYWLVVLPEQFIGLTAHGFITELSTPFLNGCWYVKKKYPSNYKIS